MKEQTTLHPIPRPLLRGTLNLDVNCTKNEDIANFAEQVSLYAGCSHHRYQILMSKQLIQEGIGAWNSISGNNRCVLWTDAVPEINKRFMKISRSTTRSLSGKDLEVLREIAGCGKDLGRESFEKMWYWLYPVAFSLSKDIIHNLWECAKPLWIEGLITKEEAENSLKGPKWMQNPGTFVLRFPTSRSWPHPDAGSLVVTYVGFDSTLHHKLLSLDLRSKFCLKRRLRIRTVQYGTAGNINQLYDSVDSETMLAILVHKVIQASLEQGVREGRMLLHDWLVILTAQYNDAYKLVQYDNGNSILRADVAFLQCPQLQPLPRLVFALLRNPLLRFHEEGVHPDYRIYLQCLFSALEPASLNRAIYPVLTSYATPDKQAYPRHSLSRAALITSGSPIFFLDAFTNLIVYYSSTADPSLPFPPPQDCLLRTTINKLKQGRCITPKLMFIRGGQDDASQFENYLIEEQDVDGSGFTSVTGFVSFLEEINQGVVEYLKQE